MGYNAAVVVLLDRLTDIENDPEFGKKLVRAIRHRAVDPQDRLMAPYVTGQTQVIGVQHADHDQIIVVGRNTGYSLDFMEGVPVDVLKRLKFGMVWASKRITALIKKAKESS